MRSRRDIDDLDNLFDRDQAAARRLEREQMIEAGKERTRQETARDAMVAARVRAFTQVSNGEAMLKEYRLAGVEPLRVNAEGHPTCSIALLLNVGWRIEDMAGEKVLVAPPPAPAWDGYQDRDSLPRKKGKP